ncbi:MAG: hypothetical protein HC913_14030 [Microscillaceae bacterium]|nr:hypothetical protein [Microscillaceae bacterium]
MKKNLCCVVLSFFLLGLLPEAKAQINLGKIKEKVGGKKEEVKQKTPATTPSATETPAPPTSRLSELKALRAQLEAENKFKVNLYLDNEWTREEYPGGVLSFTNDYAKPAEDILEFGGKDFIYARLKLPKKLTEYLDKNNLSNLIYYRVKNTLKVYNEYGESEDHMQTSVLEQFEYAYNTDEVLIPIVPERGYYDDLIASYKKDGKFESAKVKKKAHLDALARIRPAEALQFLANKSNGTYLIEANIAITAKMKGSDFKIIENLRGYFIINMDDEARERYQASYNILADRALYNEYDEIVRNAELEMAEEAEKEAMAKMTPREKQRYLALKTSPEMGLIHLYEGQKVEVKLKHDNLRTKSATVFVKWADGGPGKEAGTAAISAGGSMHGDKTIYVPLGASLSINGRTLIPSARGGETVVIHWWY